MNGWCTISVLARILCNTNVTCSNLLKPCLNLQTVLWSWRLVKMSSLSTAIYTVDDLLTTHTQAHTHTCTQPTDVCSRFRDRTNEFYFCFRRNKQQAAGSWSSRGWLTTGVLTKQCMMWEPSHAQAGCRPRARYMFGRAGAAATQLWCHSAILILNNATTSGRTNNVHSGLRMVP